MHLYLGTGEDPGIYRAAPGQARESVVLARDLAAITRRLAANADKNIARSGPGYAQTRQPR